MSIGRLTLAGSLCALVACGPDQAIGSAAGGGAAGGTLGGVGSFDGGPGAAQGFIGGGFGSTGGGVVGGLGGLFGDGGVPPGALPQRLTELHTAERPPHPISGGTLAVSADGVIAVAADPDRDTIYVVRTDSLNVRKIDLAAGSEPGRVVLDGAGGAHVVLRGTGKLLRVDLGAATAGAQATLCTQPRGIAYDAARDALVAACMDGNVVTLAAKGYAELSRKFVAYDLRDVVVGSGGRLFVSRYRSAELIGLDTSGAVRTTSRPKQGHGFRNIFVEAQPASVPNGIVLPQEPSAGTIETREVTFSPTLAWRTVSSTSGSLWMLHQESQNEEVSVSSGGYGGDCQPIAASAITQFGADGQPANVAAIAMMGVSVDVALSPDGEWLAVASPGSYLRGGPTMQLYSAQSVMGPELVMGGGCFGSQLSSGQGSQVIAVAFDDTGLLYTFSREPAELEIFDPSSRSSFQLPRVATITLDRRSMRDTGHELFHTDVGSGLSCASCHGEALDDGHVWAFDGIGPRRTQNMRGGLLGTAPFHWDGDMGDFKKLVDDVMTGRMAGFPVSDEFARALALWIDAQPALTLPAGDLAAVTRGKALFMSDATECSSCHSGDRFTNNEAADVGTGGKFQVPSLRGLGLRAPYMHDGCAKTIEARFEAPCGGGDKHGKTSQLNPAQISDLSAYLRSL